MGQQNEPERESQVKAIKRLAYENGITAFSDNENMCYFLIEEGGNRLIIPDGRDIEDRLMVLYENQYGEPPNMNMLRSAIVSMCARARVNGDRVNLHVRIGHQDGAIYYDLCNPDYQAVRITGQKVRLVKCNVKCRFCRDPNALAQCNPDLSTSSKELIPLLEKHFHFVDQCTMLFAAYLVGCFFPGIRQPALVLHGEFGSAKTTAARLTKSLVDPNKIDVLSSFPDLRDLAVILQGSVYVVFDNLNRLTKKQSDELCSLITGGQQAYRELYTNRGLAVLKPRASIALTGIDLPLSANDALDRTIALKLAAIAPEKRKGDAQVQADFMRDKPRIMGAIFNALSAVVRCQETLKPDRSARMADSYRVELAAAMAIGIGREEFENAYHLNMRRTAVVAGNHGELFQKVLSLAEKAGRWEGNATQLVSALRYDHDSYAPSTLSKDLKSLKTSLREFGVHVNTNQYTHNERKIVIASTPTHDMKQRTLK